MAAPVDDDLSATYMLGLVLVWLAGVGGCTVLALIIGWLVGRSR